MPFTQTPQIVRRMQRYPVETDARRRRANTIPATSATASAMRATTITTVPDELPEWWPPPVLPKTIGRKAWSAVPSAFVDAARI